MPRVKMEPLNVVEKVQARIRWDFQIPADKMVMANRRDIVMVDKQQKKAAAIDPNIRSNIRKKEHEMQRAERESKRKRTASSSSRSISIGLFMELTYDITKGKRL